jgi:hypothetical protein
MPRTALAICEKTTYELLPYDFDFTDVLLSGEALTDTPPIVVTSEPTTSPPLIVGMPVLSSPNVQVMIDGGLSPRLYLMRCKVTTSLGNERECVGRLLVTDT